MEKGVESGGGWHSLSSSELRPLVELEPRISKQLEKSLAKGFVPFISGIELFLDNIIDFIVHDASFAVLVVPR